jgi:hypothetical protein
MAEDSGAFKTIPRDSAQFGHFVIARPGRGNGASLVQETLSQAVPGYPYRRFITNVLKSLRYS